MCLNDANFETFNGGKSWRPNQGGGQITNPIERETIKFERDVRKKPVVCLELAELQILACELRFD